MGREKVGRGWWDGGNPKCGSARCGTDVCSDATTGRAGRPGTHFNQVFSPTLPGNQAQKARG